MLIIIHYKCSAGMVMCLLPLVREGKNASLVGPGSWLLGRVTVTPPRAQLRIRAGRGRLSWQGTSEISQPSLSVYSRKGRRAVVTVQGHGAREGSGGRSGKSEDT